MPIAKKPKTHNKSANHKLADRKSPLDALSNAGAGAAFLAALGREVRRSRAKRGMTRRQMAQASRTSERYLAQIESGAGNPSVTVLRAIAQALDLPAAVLLGEPSANSAARTALLDLVARLPDSALAELTDLIEARLVPAESADRARRIALVGLRGASIPDMIEMAGTATFRRHERAALERVIAGQEAAVITTAGGIVSERESYALLLRRSHTIWIKARPEEHMGRVMAQGDFRPMAANREAMADLVAILEARGADYARAQAQLDTSGEAVEHSFAKLQRMVADMLGPQSRSSAPRLQAGGA